MGERPPPSLASFLRRQESTGAGYPFPLGGKVRMGERPPSTSRVIPAEAGIQRGGVSLPPGMGEG